MDNLVQDLRYTLRMIGRNRGFVAAAVLTIALGVGINTAVFSVAYGVLLRPLPYPEPDRLIRVSERHPGGTSPLRSPRLSNITYNAWIGSARTIEGVAAWGPNTYTVTGLEEPLRVDGAMVSPALFSLLRTTPGAGRFFRPEEARDDATVVILSDGFWRERFGADPAAVGRVLKLDGRACTIIGVARPEFFFPDRRARLWTPYPIAPTEVSPERGGSISVFPALARLKPGATPAQAATEGTAASRGVVTRPMADDLLFGTGGPVEVQARPLIEAMTESIRPALAVLAAGVGLILLIACTNVANLIISRGLARGKEISMRCALGAGKARLFRQLLTESLVLSTAAGLFGILLAVGLIRVIPVIVPPAFPRIDDVHLDGFVVTFAALAALLAGLLSGVAPALRSASLGVSDALRAGSWSAAGGLRVARGSRTRAGLLVAEAALSTMLLIGAGLLIRSFEKLLSVDPGFKPANVLTARVYPPEGESSTERSQQFISALLDRLRKTPGVAAAGGANMAPFFNMTAVSGFSIPAGFGSDKPVTAQALHYVVTPGYAEALGMRLLEGRFFNQWDAEAADQRMLVNREFVRQYLPRGPVVGRRIEGLLTSKGKFTEIVGVVDNVLKDGLAGRIQPEIYLAAGKNRPLTSEFSVVIRSSANPLSLVPVLRGIVRDVDRFAALDQVATLDQQVSRSVSQPRFATLVMTVFASLALVLAAVGIYGVLSYNVNQRRPEMGVRAALGASRRDLVGLVLREGLTLTFAGLVIGLAAAAGITRWMSTLLFGVKPLDAPVYGIAAIVLLVMAAAACALPAQRAAAADPAEALRSE